MKTNKKFAMMMPMKAFFIATIISVSSCNSYLDIVPDNVAVLEHAFNMRSTAERYLFTCYSWMPPHASLTSNPAFMGSDEFWIREQFVDFSAPASNIVRGNQNIVNPFNNSWDGGNGGTNLFMGIRDCNIFLENIDRVPDLGEDERNRWIAEVKFLKAYYHFWLVRMYGPIPLMRENIPVSATVDEVQIPRDPVDECFDYIIGLIDEGMESLPALLDSEITELGRITQPIAKSIKAYILVTAASPLFNGNSSYQGYTNHDGTALFNTTYDADKWRKAVTACQEAVEQCHAAGRELYRFNPGIVVFPLSPEIQIQMDLRNAVVERWNREIIWGDPNSMAGGGTSGIQSQAMVRGLTAATVEVVSTRGNLAPPLHIVEMFYSENGVPITEDKTWTYSDRFQLETATAIDKYHIKEGYTTAKINYRREHRYYAYLGFDGGIWYGHGLFDDNNTNYLQAKVGQFASMVSSNSYSNTGYWTKKLVHYQNIIEAPNRYTVEAYPWPVMRLADLYLLYAEALNEAQGPSSDALNWINLVRERAGLESVENSWSQYSTQPSKYTSQEGLRDIIRRERMIELAFEGKRFWDIRRWKIGETVLNRTISGWDIAQKEAENYYRQRALYQTTFRFRDYFWPLQEQTLLVNRALVQSPGW
ncbi:RagB/SusD family nutrient uptake outer membrane protein [Sphingobacterium gobiense]|nr:RagB/SusD family nutrient uptake outer membrane protein [Sphingobacterium gobiense]